MIKNFKILQFFFALFFFPTFSFAQGISAVYELISGNDNTYYVFADVANVRSGPGIDFEIIDKLKSGTEVQIPEKLKLGPNTEKYTQNRITAYWLPVTYQKDGEKKQGYLWQGNLSFNQMRRGTTKFIYGIHAIETYTEKSYDNTFYGRNKYKAELKILVNDSLIARKLFLTDDEQTYTQGNVFDNLGLKGIENIIRIAFFGEACAIPTYYYYFAWNGKEILELPSRYTVSDAGSYYYTEKFIFPSEKGGKQDKIIMKSEEIVMDDENISDENYPVTKRTTEYLWNGKTYKKIK